MQARSTATRLILCMQWSVCERQDADVREKNKQRPAKRSRQTVKKARAKNAVGDIADDVT